MRRVKERTSMGAGVITVMAIAKIDLVWRCLWKREKGGREHCEKTRSPEAIAQDEREKCLGF